MNAVFYSQWGKRCDSIRLLRQCLKGWSYFKTVVVWLLHQAE
jgi:hypothetical protein